MVSWTSIVDRVGKKGSKRAAKAGSAGKAGALPRAAELARYHMLRRWLEPLEKRELLTGITHSGFTFTSNLGGAPATAEESALNTVFGANHSGDTATFHGTIGASSQALTGTFSITAQGGGNYQFAASGITVNLNGLVTIAGGAGTLTVGSSSVSGSLSAGSLGLGGGLSMTSPSLSMNWSSSGGDTNLQVVASLGTTGTLNIGSGQTLTGGTFTFEQSGGNITVAETNTKVSIGGGLVVVSGLNATLDITSSGIKVSAAAGIAASFDAGGAHFSGNLALGLDTTGTAAQDYLRLTGTNVAITVGGVTFSGDIGFQQVKDNSDNLVADLVGVSIANVDVSLKDNAGTTVVHMTSPAGDVHAGSFVFQKHDGNFYFGGAVSGTVTVTGGGGVTASGTVSLVLNTDTAPVSFPDPLDLAQTLEIPGGPILEVLGRDIDLNVSGSQAIHGDFGFMAKTVSSVTVVDVSASGVTGTFGAVQLSAASGHLTIAVPSGGSSISGGVTGTVSFTGGGVTSSGDFTASFDGTGTHISADNVQIIVHNEIFAGSFTVDAQPTTTTFTVTDASLHFGSGLLDVNDLSGSFTIDSGGSASGTVSGTLSASLGQGTFAGGLSVGFGGGTVTLAGTGDTLTIGDESVAGDFSIVDSGGGNVAVTASGVTANLGGGLITVGGATLSLSLTTGSVVGSFSGNVSAGTGLTAASFSGLVTVTVAPDGITASGTGDHFTVNGQTFDADFTFSKDSQGLALGISGVNFDVGGVGALVVSGASGTLLIPADKSGITGSISATFSSNLAAFSGHLDIAFAPGVFSLSATDVTLTIAGQTLTGDMGVTVNGSDLDITADNLFANLGGGLVTISPVPDGTVVPPTTLKVHNGAFSGSFSGIVSAGTVTGVGFSGLVSVAVDSTSITASGTGDVLTVGGQQITANFTFSKVGSDLKLHVDGVGFAIGTLLSVSGATGDLTVGSTGLTGSASGTVTSGIANLSGSLSVGFAPGVLKVSGTNDTLTYGTQLLQGDFDFLKDSTGLHLSITNFTADLGGGLVLVTGGSATLNVDQASGAVTGSLAGTVAAGTTLTSAGVNFGGSISVIVGNGVIKASGTGDTLTIAGNTFTTSFDFTKDSTGLYVSVKGLSFTLGSVLSVAGASGTLQITSAGISGSTSGNVTSTLAGLSGTLGVGFSPGHLLISGTNDSITIGGQSLVGDFTFAANGPDLDLDITNLTANLGGGLVKISGLNGAGATGHLTVHAGQVSGSFNGFLAVGSGTGFAFSGGIAVAVDSAAGTITADGTNDTLTIGGQSISGNFGFAKTGSDLQLTIANVALNIGGIISVSNVHGTVVVGPTGVSGSVAGTIGQTLTGLTADSFGVSFAPGFLQVEAVNAALVIGGQSIKGTFDFRQDGTGTHLTSSNISASLGGGLVKVVGGSANLTVASGQVSGGFSGQVSVDTAMTGGAVGFSGLVSVQVSPGSIVASGTADTLTVAGYQLTTDFSFAKVGSDLDLTLANLNFSLGGALTISNAGGTLLVNSGGVSGSAFGTVSSNISGVDIHGQLGVAFAPGTLSISGTNDYLEASGQKVSGDFTFTKDATGLHLTASNFSASLGNGLVTVDNGSGTLDVANGAISGSFSGMLHAGTVGGGVSFDGPINVSVSASGISASTGAGQVDTLTIGSQVISAGFSFTKDAAGLDLTVTDLTATLGPVSLTDGGGTLLISSTGVSGTAFGTLSTSFTGFTFTGTLAATFAPGLFELTGTNNQLTVGDQSISGDFSFLKDITGVHLSASNLAASFGGVVSITNGSGTLDVSSGGEVSGSFAATVSAGAGTSGFSFSGPISVAVAPGTITASTPNGQTDTLVVLANTMSASFYFHKDASGLELDVTHVNLSFANGTVAVNDAGGTLLVTKTGVTGSLHGGLTASVPNVVFNSTNFDIAFSPGTLAISGTGVSLTAYGQSISGNFSFVSNPNSVTLHIDSLALSLGGIVNVTSGTGDFTLTKGVGGGMTGSASGNVQIAGVGPDVQFGGTFAVAIGNNTVSVSGTGTSLTLFGQKLAGNFSFTKTASNVNLHVNALNLNLGGGLLLVTGGAADFNIASGGVTGSASGTLSVGSGLTGVSFGGTVAVVITNTGLSVTGTNTQITIAGQTVTADQISFARDSSTGVLDASITNLGLAIDGNPLPIALNGTLVIAPTGMAGTLTGHANLGGVDGTVSVNFGNGQFSVSAGVNASFSQTIGPVAISGTISAQGSTGGGGSASISLTDLTINMGNGLLTITGGSADFNYTGGKISGTATGTLSLNGVPGVTLGGTVTVTFTNGATPTISVVGTNMALGVLGQTLSGNFSFVDNGDGTIALGASNVSVALADSISLTGGAASFTLGKNGANAGLSGTGSGNLSVSLPGVGFSTAFGLTIDNTNGQSLFKVAANPMTITVGGIGLTGSFVVQKVTTATGKTTVSIVASDIDTFLGDGTTGLHISNAGGSILILPTGSAIDVYGTAALEGIDGLTLGGTMHVRMNNTGAAINQVVPAPDPAHPGQTINQTLSFAGNQSLLVSGTATLGVGDGSGNTFVALSGGFSFSTSASTAGNVTTTKLLIGAAGVDAFLGTGDPSGPDAIGVKVSGANLGIAVIGTKNNVTSVHTSVYALTASGNAALLGVPVLSLSGSLAVRSNTAGVVHEVVQVPDPANPGSNIPVAIDFTANTQAFSGSVALALADPGDPTKQYVSLSGDFAFSKSVAGSTTTITAAVNNAAAFIGVGGANPIGVQLTGGTLGLVMLKTGAAASTYALAASGNIAVVGLPGLYVGGAIAIRSNTTGSAQPNPAGGANIPTGGPVVTVTGMTMAIKDSDDNDIISISVDATIQKLGALVDINATSATFTLNAGTQPLASVTGAVEFTIGANGLNLGAAGFQILGFSILGDAIQAAGPVPAPLPGGGSNGAVVHAPTATGAPTGASTAGTGTGASITLPVGVTPRKLGPLSVYNLAPAFNGFSFSGGNLSVNIGLKADAATLALGSAAGAGGAANGPNAGGVTAAMTGFQGTLGLAVGLDLSSFRVTSFGPTGAFDFHATQFVLDVPNVVNVNASNIDIHYDPKATGVQKVLSIDTATITVPFGAGGNGIQGQIAPALDANGKTIPGLQVWTDHLQLGRASLKYIGNLGISSFLQITNPFIAITDLTASFNGSLDFQGSITLGADSVKIGPSAFQFTGTAISATLTHSGSDWDFLFKAGTLGVTVASVVSLNATNVTFDPGATGTETLLSVASLNAVLSLSKLTLTGTAGAGAGDTMKILGNGTPVLPDHFFIDVQFSAGSSGDLGWPSWMPIQIQDIQLDWPHFNTDKTNFTITLSAHIGGSYGPVTLDGDVSNVVIDVNKLKNGQFPITNIDYGLIHASGPAFGGTIDGTLIIGVIKLDSDNHRIDPADHTTIADHTVFYAGIEASLQLANFGVSVRLGISQNGPLEVYVEASGDILLDPVSELALKQLYGGVTFGATPFPSISNAADLKSPAFTSGVEIPESVWVTRLQQEVVNQSGGGGGGYLFALTGADATSEVASLNSGTVDAALKAAFLNAGEVVTTAAGATLGVKPATVTVEVAGLEWVIENNHKFYLLTKNLNGSISVSQYSFVVDNTATGSNGTVTVASPTDIVTALNAGAITATVSDMFKAYGMFLTPSAVLKANAPATPGAAVNSWTITDGVYSYKIVRDANGVLTVSQSGGSMDNMNGVIRIEAGVTLGFFAVPTSEISFGGDIIIETDGKILLSANAQVGAGAIAFDFRAFIDLSGAATGHVAALFYFEKDVTIPGVGTFPQLIVAGGVVFGRTDALGNMIDPSDHSSVAAGFGIDLTGEIQYSYIPSVSITLTGTAAINITNADVTFRFNATLSASLTSFIQANNFVTAAGAFTMQYSPFALYGAAELQFQSGAIPFLSDVGMHADAEIFLRINTDINNGHEILFDLPVPGSSPTTYTHEDFHLEPASFGLYLVGELTLKKGPIDFYLDGVFDIDFKVDKTTGTATFDMFAFASLHLGVAGQNIINMQALGLIEIDNDGFAAMLSVSTAVDATIFDFDFDFTAFTNTTGHDVTYTLPSDLTAILSQMDGQVDASSGGLLDQLKDQFGRLATLYGSGAHPLVGADPSDATRLSITIPGGMPKISLTGEINGIQAPGPYFIVQGGGHIGILDTFTVDGSFLIAASTQGVELGILGHMQLGPLASIGISGYIDITAAGLVAALSLDASITLGGIASLSGAATLEINTTGVNQTVKEYTYDQASGTVSNTPQDVVLLGTTVLRAYVSGEIVLAGFFTLQGTVSMEIDHGITVNGHTTDALIATVDAHMSGFMGFDLHFSGAAGVYFNGADNGFVLDLTASMNVGLPSVASLSMDLTLQINTFTSGVSLPDPAHPLTNTINVPNGVHITYDGDLTFLSIVSFHTTGSIIYDNVSHLLTITFDTTLDLNLFIFKTSVEIKGWINSTGQFAVGVRAAINANVVIASIDGSAYLDISFLSGSPVYDSNHLPSTNAADIPTSASGSRVLTIAGGGHLGIDIFGINIAAVDIDFSVNSNLDIYFHAVAHLNFLLFSVNIGFTVNVGSFGSSNKPPSVYLAGTPTLSGIDPGAFTGGPLVLNVGNRQGNRNFDAGDTNEIITVRGADPGQPGAWNPVTKTQTIYVTIGNGINAYTQAFNNVSSLSIPATGANLIAIADTVYVPVSATTNGGKILNAGQGAATLTGGSGNDLIESGSGATTIVGGGGHDTIVVGTGSANVTTTGPGSSLLWNTDTSGSTIWAGNANDVLYATANTPGSSYANGESLTFSKVAANSAKLTHDSHNSITFSNVPTVLLNAPGGGNIIAVGDLAGTGVTSISVSYGQSHSAGDALSVAGTTGADNYTLSSSTALLPVVPSAANLTPAASTLSVPTNTIARAGGLSITLFGTSATAGDSVAVNSKGGNDNFYVQSVSLPTTLQGNDATAPLVNPYTTYYYVGWQGAGVKGTLSSVTALLAIHGSNGKDVLVMDDSDDFLDRTFNLTDTQLVSDALGIGGRLTYDAKMDNFNLFAGAAHNKFVISGTSAVGATQIYGGDTDLVINAPLVAPIAVNGGDSLGGINTLTINGTFAADFFTIGAGYVLGAGAPLSFVNFQALVVSGNGGNDTYLVTGSTIPVSIVGSAGDETVTIDGNSAPVTVDSGAGHDTFILNGAAAPVDITAQANGDFTVNGNSAVVTLTGGPGVNTFNVNANAGTLTLNGGAGLAALNTFNLLGNSRNLTANSVSGAAIFTVTNIASAVALVTGDLPASFHVIAALHAPVNITGSNTTVHTMIVDGTAGADAFILSNTQVKGAGADINYTGLLAVTINGLGGNDSFLVTSTNAPAVLNAGLGNSTFNVQTINDTLAITTGTGISASTVNLATTLANLQGAVTVTGTTHDILNIADTANSLGGTGTLTDTTLTGFGMAAGGITFTGIKNLNLTLGSGADNLTVNSVSNTTTAVAVNTAGGADIVNLVADTFPLSLLTGAGANTINAGDLAPTLTGGKLVKLQGAVSINGTGGTTTLNLDNTGDTAFESATLSSTSLTGLGMGSAGITYTALSAINLSLGSGGNAFTLASTAAATLTNLTGGPGNDAFSVLATSSPTTITTGAGTNSVTVTGLSAIQGSLAVTGNGTDTLTLDDTASSAVKTGTLTPTTITGFGLGSSGITYNAIDVLNLNLGNGNLTVTVNGTAAGTNTTLTTGTGADNVTVNSTGTSPTTVQTGAGNDTVTVRSTAGPTTVAVGTGTNAVTVASVVHTLDLIQAPLTLTGNGIDTITLDDTGSVIAKTTSLDASVVNVSGSSTIDYAGDTGLATLNLNLGSGIASLTILTTRAAATTNVNTGSDNDVVTITTTGGTTNLNTGDGDDNITVRATAAPTTITTGTGTNTLLVTSTIHTLDGIQGSLNIIGSGTNTLTLDDSGAALARTGNLTASAITGFGMATTGVSYAGVSYLNLDLGTGGTALTVTDTNVSAFTTVNASTGSDAFTLLDNHGVLLINTSAGGTNTVNVAATSAVLSLITGLGAHDTITLGSNHSASNLVIGIYVNGSAGTTDLTVDDTATTTARTATLSATDVTGLSPAVITYIGLDTLTILLGSGANNFTVADTAAPTTLTGGTGDETFTIQDNHDLITLNTGTGTNTVAVQGTDAAVNITSPATAVNTVTLSNAGLTGGITAPVTLTGNGADTLTLDDSANSAPDIVTIAPTFITGVTDSAVNFTGVHTFNLTLGSAGDILSVTDTAPATITNIDTAAGDDALTVTTTSGPLNLTAGTGANTASILANTAAITLTTPAGGSTATTIGNAGNIDGIAAPVSVTGAGTLVLDDTANTTAKIVTLTSAAITGLAPAAITYTGLTTLTLDMGTGDDVVNVTSTSATPTAINTHGGSDNVSVSATTGSLLLNTGTGNNLVNFSDLPAFAGPVVLNGSGFDILTLDESANTAATAGTLSATQITGLSPATITYGGVATLTVTFGSNTNTFNVKSSSASTTLASGAGTDHINVGSTAPTAGGVMSGITSPLAVLGNDNDTLTLDDSGSSAGKTIAVTARRVTGLAPAPVNFDNLAQLSILLGTGNDTVTVNDTLPPSTSLNTGAGNDTVNVVATTNSLSINTGAGTDTVSIAAPDDIHGTVAVDGTGGTATFNVDASAQTTAKSVTVTSTAVTGVTPATLTYVNLTTLNLALGTGDDQVLVSSTAANTTTNLNTGPGNDAVTLSAATDAPLGGTLNLDGSSGTNTLLVDGTANPNPIHLTLSATTIAGLGAAATYTNFGSLNAALGSGANTLDITGADPNTPITASSAGTLAASLHFAGDYTGNVTLPANTVASVAIDGSLTGTLIANGSFDTVTIGQDLAGTLATPGNLHSLTINGNDTGTISAGSIDTIFLPHAHAGAGGTVFSATQAGVDRNITAISAKGNALPDVSFAVVYDGSSGANPTAAVRVTNGRPKAERFDLILGTDVAFDAFDLTRIDTKNGKVAGIRNLVISGSLLNTMSTPEAALLGTPKVKTGGVYLPADNLAAVAVRRNLPTNSVTAKSVQALAFATYTDNTGKTRSSTQLAADPDRWASLLKSTFVANPKTHAPYTKVLTPTEPLRVIADGHEQAIFVGKMSGKTKSLFDPHTLYITDHAGDGGTVDALVTLAKTPRLGRPVVNNVAFTGTGGSIRTTDYVNHISSTGPLADVWVNAGNKEVLQTIDAPSITGKVKLFGGKLIK